MNSSSPTIPAAGRSFRLKHSLAGAALAVLLTLLAGCAALVVPVSRYDPVTYEHLTDLKPEVVMLYQSFTRSQLDTQRVEKVRLELEQANEYEVGKGPDNGELVAQLAEIRGTFDADVARRAAGGPWSTVQTENRAALMRRMFDMAIATERAKNPTRNGQ